MTTVRIPDGYSVCSGTCGDDWYAGVLRLPDEEHPFLVEDSGPSYRERCHHWRRWDAAVGTPKRMIELVRPDAGELRRSVVASAERIEGPVCPREAVDRPVLAWIERRNGGWELVVHDGVRTRIVTRRQTTLRCPQVAAHNGALFFACEYDTPDRGNGTAVFDTEGATLVRLPGRRPVLIDAGGRLLLLTEQPEPNRVKLLLQSVAGDHVMDESLVEQGDYLINADMIWCPERRAAFIVAESAPALGYGCQVGLHRTIHVWRAAEGRLSPLPEVDNALPVPRSSFGSLGPENRPPIQPRLLLDGVDPVVLFRQFRYFRLKTFGWDVLWCRWNGTRWDAPRRLTPSLSTPDTSYSVRKAGEGRFLGFFPAHDNVGGPARNTNHRVEILSFETSDLLPPVAVPEKSAAPYTLPPQVRDVAPLPATLRRPYEGRTLIWGDLHVHTCYSHCMAAVDGTPEENLRFYRDVLGCRVFTLTEHTWFLTGPGSTWTYDRLEQIAGSDALILYGTEPGMRHVRHTNWYTRDRRSSPIAFGEVLEERARSREG